MSDLEQQTPLREGLPPTYRMRADSHYVDLMEARATEPKAAVLPAEPQESTQRLSDIGDPTLHAGRDLAQAIATLANCAALLSDAPSELSRTVVGDLIKAEAWRASALLHATRVVRNELSVVRTAVSVSGVLDKVMLAFQAERRVRAITIDAVCAAPDGSVVFGDEQMITGALSWALLSSLALIGGVADARLAVSVSSGPGPAVAFTVSQPSVTPPSVWEARAFDPSWTERPGGVPVLVWMLALRETARVHGGAARVERSDRGTTIVFSLPTSV